MLAPREMQLKNRIIHKGNKFTRRLNLDGRTIALELHFRKDNEESGFVPMISVFFNGRIVWEDYLYDETLTFTLESEVGENTLVVTPINRPVIIRKITYQIPD